MLVILVVGSVGIVADPYNGPMLEITVDIVESEDNGFTELYRSNDADYYYNRNNPPHWEYRINDLINNPWSPVAGSEYRFMVTELGKIARGGTVAVDSSGTIRSSQSPTDRIILDPIIITLPCSSPQCKEVDNIWSQIAGFIAPNHRSDTWDDGAWRSKTGERISSTSNDININKQDLNSIPRSNKGGIRGNPTKVVLHHTGEFGADESEAIKVIEKFKNPSSKVSAHYLIDRDGTIYQLVNDNEIANHAGNSGINQQSIGIEIINSGKKNDVYTSQQYLALNGLLDDFENNYGIQRTNENIIGHYEVVRTEGVRWDPSPNFEWFKIRLNGHRLLKDVKSCTEAKSITVSYGYSDSDLGCS